MTLSKDTDTGLNVVPLWINGQNTTSTSARFPVYCFEQQKDVFLAESADKESATRAVDAALKAFKTWKKTPVIPRRNLLLKVASIVRARVEELVQAQREETSVIELWARKNVSLAADVVEEVASSLSSMRGEIPQTASEGSLALVLNEPIGPILTIAPWNSSIILALRAISTPIAAGCTVVLKASELCPRTHHLLAEIFEEAGLPAGVLNVVQTRREDAASITETIIAHPGIRKIDFIGSAPVGKLIGQVAAKYLKPILMELGGKGPAIVLDDADLEQAAKKCITGAFLHHGQLCFSTERIIVLEKIAPQFQELLRQEAAHFIPGSGAAEGLVDKSKDKLVDAEKKGAKFLIGGPSYGGIASLVPTILTGVTPEMEIYHEESFGPSVALFIARDDAHAIEIANDTPYGLNAAIHSKDMGRALDVAREIECAQVHINNMTAHDEPTLPVGGSRGSGWGRCNASWGLNEFVAPKLITLSATGNKFL